MFVQNFDLKRVQPLKKLSLGHRTVTARARDNLLKSRIDEDSQRSVGEGARKYLSRLMRFQ